MYNKTQKEMAEDWLKLVEFCYKLGFEFDGPSGLGSMVNFVTKLAKARQAESKSWG